MHFWLCIRNHYTNGRFFSHVNIGHFITIICFPKNVINNRLNLYTILWKNTYTEYTSFRYQIQFVQGLETRNNSSVFSSISPCFLSYGITNLRFWDDGCIFSWFKIFAGNTRPNMLWYYPLITLGSTDREILAVMHYSREFFIKHFDKLRQNVLHSTKFVSKTTRGSVGKACVAHLSFCFEET